MSVDEYLKVSKRGECQYKLWIEYHGVHIGKDSSSRFAMDSPLENTGDSSTLVMMMMLVSPVEYHIHPEVAEHGRRLF